MILLHFIKRSLTLDPSIAIYQNIPDQILSMFNSWMNRVPL